MPGADRLVPTYLIKLNNKRLPPEMSADLQAIAIEEHLSCPAMFLLTFSRQKQCWCAHKDLSLGSNVIIEMGYLNGTKVVLDGEITGDGAEYSSFEPAYTTIKGYDRLHRLARRHMTRTFRDMKDWQIAQQIAEETHLAADIQDKAGEPHAYVVQNGLQDLAFLLERARRAGREIGVNGKNLYWRKPAEDLEPVAVLEWGKSLREFSVNVTGMGEKSEVIVRGMDPKTQQAIVWREESLADMPFGRAREVVIDNSVKSMAEAENLAKAVLREKQMEYMKAEGSCLGNPDIHVGQTLMIKGVADKVAGKYYIVQVEHELHGQEGYITRFKLKKPKPPSEKKKTKSAARDESASTAAAMSAAGTAGSKSDQNPSLTQAQWSQSEVKRGDRIKLSATTENIPDNTEIAFVVSFMGKDNQTPTVLHLPAKVKNNKLEADWKFKERPEGDKAPADRYPTYYFEAEYQGQKAKSGELQFKEPINIFVLVPGTRDPGNTKETTKSNKSYWYGSIGLLSQLKEFENEYYDLYSYTDFEWNGNNEKADRKAAGKKLAEDIRSNLRSKYQEIDQRDVSLHLIGHSHGGNVINEFTRAIKTGPWPKYWQIKSITYLSTPFFRHEHAVDTAKFHPDWKIINIFNPYDLTQRVIADFSLHDLHGILPMLEKQGIKDLAKKISGTDWPKVVKELRDALTITAATEAATVVIPGKLAFNTSAGFPLINGKDLYDACKVLFQDLRMIIDKIGDAVNAMLEIFIAARPAISEDLAYRVNDKLREIAEVLDFVISKFKQQNHYTLVNFIRDLQIKKFVDMVKAFIEINAATLKGELAGYVNEIVSEQLEEFDDTVKSPSQQLPDKSKIKEVNISKIDYYYGQRDKEFDKFIRYLEDVERKCACGGKPGQYDLLDAIFTLLAQTEFVHDELYGVLDWTAKTFEILGGAFSIFQNDNNQEINDKQDFWATLRDIAKIIRAYQNIFAARLFGRGVIMVDDAEGPDGKRGSLEYLLFFAHSISRKTLFEQGERDEEKEQIIKIWQTQIDAPKRKDVEE